MNAHTLGPWKFGKELTARSGEWLVSFDAGSKGRGIAIAETRAGSGNEEVNARLIAASPDLLAALQMVLDAIQSGVPDVIGYGEQTKAAFTHGWNAALNMLYDRAAGARDAVAKATGSAE